MREATHHDERQLVRRLLAGDERAFEEFSDRYLPALYRFAGSRLGGDRELTREIVQTTACRIVAKLDTYRGEATLLTWMGSICRNEIAMHFRRLGRRPREVEWSDTAENRLENRVRSATPEAEERLVRDEQRTLVHMVLDLLPVHYAQALEWKYIDGLPVKEIAARLGLGAKAAESLLTRARESFRAQYDRNMEPMPAAKQFSDAAVRRVVSKS